MNGSMNSNSNMNGSMNSSFNSNFNPNFQQSPQQSVQQQSNGNHNGWVGFGGNTNNQSPPQVQQTNNNMNSNLNSIQGVQGDMLTGMQSGQRDSKNAILGKYKSNASNEFMTSLGQTQGVSKMNPQMMTQMNGMNGMNPMGMNPQMGM